MLPVPMIKGYPLPRSEPTTYRPDRTDPILGYVLDPTAVDKQRTGKLRDKLPDKPLRLGRDVTQYIIDMLDIDDATDAYLLCDIFGGDLDWMVDAVKRRISVPIFLSPIIGAENVDSFTNAMVECDVVACGWRVADYFIRGLSSGNEKLTLICCNDYYRVLSFCKYLYDIGYRPVADNQSEYEIHVMKCDINGRIDTREGISTVIPKRHVALEFKPINPNRKETISLVMTKMDPYHAALAHPASNARCVIDGIDARHPFYYFAKAGICTFPGNLLLTEYLSKSKRLAINSAGRLFQRFGDFEATFGPDREFKFTPAALNKIYNHTRRLIVPNIVINVDGSTTPATITTRTDEVNQREILRFGSKDNDHVGYTVAVVGDGVPYTDIKQSNRRLLYGRRAWTGVDYLGTLAVDVRSLEISWIPEMEDILDEYNDLIVPTSIDRICRLGFTLREISPIPEDRNSDILTESRPISDIRHRLFPEGDDSQVISSWMNELSERDDHIMRMQIRRCMDYGATVVYPDGI